MLDFLTLAFDDNTEISLLQLQAISFKYIQPTMIDHIGNIFLFYNDIGIDKIEFIKQYYPEELRSKVSIIYRDSITEDCEKSNWRNQQYFKLYFCKYIESEYYVVLDGKNHFIREVNLHDFISNGKPKLYLDNPGCMIKFYESCLSYFNIENPFKYQYDYNLKEAIGNNILLTTTPFIFITKQVSNLISYIENKEQKPFYDFFMNSFVTEFYLYSTYLIFSNKIDYHDMVPMDDIFVTIFKNPNVEWNKFERKKHAITDTNVKVFGLHRDAVKNMDDDYKQCLLYLYACFFDDNTCSMIKSFMYDSSNSN